MKTILVRYHGPTNQRGARWVARAEGVKPLSVSDNDRGLDDVGQQLGKAARVAQRLAERQDWRGRWLGGDAAGGWVFVQDNALSFPFEVRGPEALKGHWRIEGRAWYHPSELSNSAHRVIISREGVQVADLKGYGASEHVVMQAAIMWLHQNKHIGPPSSAGVHRMRELGTDYSYTEVQRKRDL